MAEVAIVEIIKINSFTVDSAPQRGLEGLQFTKNAPETYWSRDEGDLQPDTAYQMPSDAPPVVGSVSGRSAAVHALAGTTATSVTVAGIDARDGEAVTMTFSSVVFKAVQNTTSERGKPSHSVAMEAASYALA